MKRWDFHGRSSCSTWFVGSCGAISAELLLSDELNGDSVSDDSPDIPPLIASGPSLGVGSILTSTGIELERDTFGGDIGIDELMVETTM